MQSKSKDRVTQAELVMGDIKIYLLAMVKKENRFPAFSPHCSDFPMRNLILSK